MKTFLAKLFAGCRCAEYTFPQTDRDGNTHVTCLHCGKEFEYDWQTMARGKSLAELRAA